MRGYGIGVRIELLLGDCVVLLFWIVVVQFFFFNLRAWDVSIWALIWSVIKIKGGERI